MELQEEGFRFHPTDSELLKFLLRFISKQPLCDDGFIAELDIYKHEPWVTYGSGCHCGGEDDGDTSIFRYFITPRHKKKEGNGRFRRVVGVGKNLGTWKQLDSGKEVISNSLIIGLKKSLSYDANKKNSSCPPHDHGKWLMKEYELSESILKRFTNCDLRDYVICAIKSKPNKNSSNAAPTPINMIEPTVQFQEAGHEENDPTSTSQINVSLLGNNDAVILRDHMSNEYYSHPIIPEAAQIQEENDLTFTSQINALLENNDPVMLRDMSNEYYSHPINPVEVQTQEENGVLGFENHEFNVPVLPQYQEAASSGEDNDLTSTSQIDALLENNDPVILMDVWYEDYGMNGHPINSVEMQVQEAAGEENGVLGFENHEFNVPVLPQYQPSHEGCTFGVNEDPTACGELRANELYTSFAELLYN